MLTHAGRNCNQQVCSPQGGLDRGDRMITVSILSIYYVVLALLIGFVRGWDMHERWRRDEQRLKRLKRRLEKRRHSD